MSNGFLLPQKIPSSPGVYFFKNAKGQILYIGKAANLKNRLASYRRLIHIPGPTWDVDKSRISKMLETATDLSWQETGSEIEALILESQLIKKHRPLFNIMLRDGKQYFFVGITQEEFPIIFLTHQPAKLSKSAIHLLENSRATSRGSRVGRMADLLKISYHGPFTEGSSLKTTLRLLRKIFPHCTCKQKHNRYCLNYHIGNCLGFCCLNPVRSRGTLRALAASYGM
ncbi:MAG: GIY-YIG nuclease family protein, partial [bacterium]|nr:GIY-YIG nuclease family protein [bacterium]